MRTKDQSNTTTEKPAEPASEFERFRDALKQIISVPKSEIDKREVEWKAERAAKKKSRVKA